MEAVKNHLPGYRITELFAFLCVGEDNVERIMTVVMPNGEALPLLMTSKKSILLLRKLAEAAKKTTPTTQVRLMRFSKPKELELPKDGSNENPDTPTSSITPIRH